MRHLINNILLLDYLEDTTKSLVFASSILLLSLLSCVHQGPKDQNPKLAPETATDIFIESGNDVKLAVRRYGGTDRPVIFLHGGPGPNLANWDYFARQLSNRYQPITYDHRGHGQSTKSSDYSNASLAQDLETIIRKLDLKDPIVVGHSWGGQIALLHAAKYSSLAGIVAVDGIITGKEKKTTNATWKWLEDQLRNNPVHRKTNNFVGSEADLKKLLVELRKEIPTHHSDFSEETFRRDLVVGADGLLHHNRTADEFLEMNRIVDNQDFPHIEQVYGRIKVPVMLVMATKGQYERTVVEGIGKKYPQLRIQWLESGHSVQKERPKELMSLIDSFASSLN